MEMKANGFLDTGCDLKNPNFAAMAECDGCQGHPRRAAGRAARGAHGDAFAHRWPVLVDVVSARQELARCRRRPRFDQAHHFGLFMVKAVLDGRGAQLIDLAKVNLR
jgi:pyruvate dehydrogenase (quinone)